ncbi:MAG: hypothetical protein ACK417_00445 [Bacteroidia bacterium]
MRKFAALLRAVQVLVVLLFSTPFIMLLLWFFTPKKNLHLTIVDKTVLNTDYEEHKSLFWFLNHHKLSHPIHGKRFNLKRDYYGFFPGNKPNYEIKGLSQLTKAQWDSIVAGSDYIYFTDTYGIFEIEWHSNAQATERSGIIYGGLSKADLYVLDAAKAAGKTIITEFNCFGSPTASSERKAFEDMFGLKWSGWIGRYIDKLDTTINREIPFWMKNGYVNQHGHWPFTKSGIVLVSETDQIEILEINEHLTYPVPVIYTDREFQKLSHLPDTMPYPFWFDIMEPGKNAISAHYKIHSTAEGDSLLARIGLSNQFPAILSHSGYDYQFYYFAGDFSDNPVNYKRSYFKGIRFFREFFYDPTEPSDRLYFFWEYYLPLMDYLFKK